MTEINNTNELLIRVDERTQSIQTEIKSIKTELDDIRKQMKEDKIEERNALKDYVTKDEFQPIQRSFYAVAGLIIMTVVGTLLSLVLHK